MRNFTLSAGAESCSGPLLAAGTSSEPIWELPRILEEDRGGLRGVGGCLRGVWTGGSGAAADCFRDGGSDGSGSVASRVDLGAGFEDLTDERREDRVVLASRIGEAVGVSTGPGVGGGASEKSDRSEPPSRRSILRRYWWVDDG